MKFKLGVNIFGLTEILIGSITFLAVTLSFLQGKSSKPLEVLIFVLVSAAISTGLGLGILKRCGRAYYLLLYFSSIIILSKLLLFAKIITLNGALETAIHSSLKNTVSVFYHSLLILYFTRSSIREEFKK